MNANVPHWTRRQFLSHTTGSLACIALGSMAFGQEPRHFRISLCEESLKHEIVDGTFSHREFAAIAKSEFDIDAVEYVSRFFSDVVDDELLAEMNLCAAENGVRQVLIRVDDQGDLAAADGDVRRTAIENHRRWIEYARTLGCHGIGVMISNEEEPAQVAERAIDSLKQLMEFATTRRIRVMIANTAGPSANPDWLLGLIEQVAHDDLGTLAMFSPFEGVDPYEGMKQLMPSALGVAAISKSFDEQWNETTIDYSRMLQVVLDSGYQSHISIDFRGNDLQGPEGIKATKLLLERGQSGSTELEIP